MDFKKLQIDNINPKYYIDNNMFKKLNDNIYNFLSNDCYFCIYKDKINSYLTIKGYRYSIHRLLYINLIGPLNDHNYLVNTCSNNKCANPYHYALKTYKNNNKIKMISRDKLIPNLNKNGEIILKFM